MAISMACEWSPTTPTRLNKKELRQYRAGRNAIVAEAVKLMGAALILEV
jgi:hypothetical protein